MKKKSKFEFFSIKLSPNVLFSPILVKFAQKLYLLLKKVPYRRTLQWVLWVQKEGKMCLHNKSMAPKLGGNCNGRFGNGAPFQYQNGAL